MKNEIGVVMALRVIGRKGTLVILQELQSGPKRFTFLERALGVSPRTLSERLKELERGQLIDRFAYAEVPPRVEYTLTPKGRALEPLIQAMREWDASYENIETPTLEADAVAY